MLESQQGQDRNHRYLNARLLRYRSRPGSEDPHSLAEDLLRAERYGDARGVVVTAQQGDDGDQSLLLLEGRAWLLERDYLRAQAVLLQALRADPVCPDVYRWLGEVMLKRGDPERACRALSKGLEMSPDDTVIQRLQERAARLAQVLQVEAGQTPPPSPSAAGRHTVDGDRSSASSEPWPLGRHPSPPPVQASAEPDSDATAHQKQLSPSTGDTDPGFGIAPEPPTNEEKCRTLDEALSDDDEPSTGDEPLVCDDAAEFEELSSLDDATDLDDGLIFEEPSSGDEPLASADASEFEELSSLEDDADSDDGLVFEEPASRAEPLASADAPEFEELASLDDVPDSDEGLALPEPANADEPMSCDMPSELEAWKESPVCQASDGEPSATALPGRRHARPALGRGATLSRFRAAVVRRLGVLRHLRRPKLSDLRGPRVGKAASTASIPSRGNRALRALGLGFGSRRACGPVGPGALPISGEPAGVPARSGRTSIGSPVLDFSARPTARFRLRFPRVSRPRLRIRAPQLPKFPKFVLPREELRRVGGRVGRVLLVSSALGLLLAALVPGAGRLHTAYRQARASDALAAASAAMLLGDQSRLAEAEQYLRRAESLDAKAERLPELRLLFHVERALDGGKAELEGLRAAVGRVQATRVGARYRDMASTVTAVLSGGWPASSRTALAPDEELARVAAKAGEDPALLYVAGRAARQLGSDRASGWLKAARDKNPGLLGAAVQLAEIEREAGRTAQALGLLEGVLKSTSGHLRARLWQLFMTAGNQDPAAGLASLDGLTESLRSSGSLDRVLAALTRARLLHRQGATAGAAASLRRAFAATEGRTRLLTLAAEGALGAKQPGLAHKAVKEVLAQLPEGPFGRAARLSLVGAVVRGGDATAALEVLAPLPASDPGATVLLDRTAAMVVRRAQELVEAARMHDAQAQLDLLPARARNGVAATVVRARVALGLGEPDKGLELLEGLPETEKNRPRVKALLGDAFYAVNRVDRAAVAYNAALAGDSELPEALVGRAEVDVRSNRPERALVLLQRAEQALGQDTRGPLFHARMLTVWGHALLQRVNGAPSEEARQQLQKATQLQGVLPEAFFWLGESQAGVRVRQAKAAYKRYLELQPEGRYVSRAMRALTPRDTSAASQK